MFFDNVTIHLLNNKVQLCRAGEITADVVIKYPKFSSAGFIAFPRPPARHTDFDVDVEFRPHLLTGLLLFIADDVYVHARFFSVAVIKGRVEFR